MVHLRCSHSISPLVFPPHQFSQSRLFAVKIPIQFLIIYTANPVPTEQYSPNDECSSILTCLLPNISHYSLVSSPSPLQLVSISTNASAPSVRVRFLIPYFKFGMVNPSCRRSKYSLSPFSFSRSNLVATLRYS